LSDPTDLGSCGYFLLPIPKDAKYPPPTGWIDRKEPYEIPAHGNVAIGMRGDGACLITNDEPATAWAVDRFGPPHVRTPRGGHWYFRARAGQGNEANRETAVGTIELHVRNKYALVPPSIHPTGVAYRWERELPPLVDLPECPDLRDLWHPRGKHHGQLLRMSAAKAHVGMRPAQAAAELIAWRDAHLPDPEAHPDRELVKLAESACLKFAPATPPPSDADRVTSPLLFTITTHERSGAPDEKRPDRAAFEAGLAEEFRFATPRDSQQLLICRDGVYVPADTYVAAWVQRRFEELGLPASSHFVSEVLGSLRRGSYREPEDFDPPHLLPLSNGYLDVSDGSYRVYESTGEPRFTYRLPVSFDAGAKCPEFEKAVAFIFPGDTERFAFQQFCGYILDPTQRHKVGGVILGAPNIGKSAIIEAVARTFGDDATIALSLRELCESRFAAWPLVGKLLSVCSDLPYAPIEHTGLYKQITGGDRVKVEPKGGRPHQRALRVKFLFGANVLPRISTTDDTVFSRFLVLLSEAKPIPKADRDLQLSRKLAAESAGILQWALQGRNMLETAGGFEPGLLERSERLWMESSDPVGAFVEACVVASPLARTDRADLLEALEDWIESKGLTLFDRDPAKRMAALIRARFPSVREDKDSKARWWIGIELVEEYRGSNGRKSEIQGLGKKIGTLDYLPGSEPDSGFAAIRATGLAPGPSECDPGDLFGGVPTRADRARARLGPIQGGPDSSALQSERDEHRILDPQLRWEDDGGRPRGES
jgi:P4 family phage/plasmid primase-like protien